MPYFEKVFGRRVRLDGKTYHAALISFEIGKFFTLALCLNLFRSRSVRIFHLKEGMEQTEEVIAQYLRRKGMVGKKFPNINDTGWKISRYRLADVVKGPAGVCRLVGRSSYDLRRSSGRRLGRNLWHRQENVKNGGGALVVLRR